MTTNTTYPATVDEHPERDRIIYAMYLGASVTRRSLMASWDSERLTLELPDAHGDMYSVGSVPHSEAARMLYGLEDRLTEEVGNLKQRLSRAEEAHGEVTAALELLSSGKEATT